MLQCNIIKTNLTVIVTVIRAVNRLQTALRYFRRASLGGVLYTLKHNKMIVPQAL
jgi:hypothetical protein